MIAFPHAKINIGLQVLNKRPDQFHEIQSLLYPIPFHDALEILPSEDFSITIYDRNQTGINDNIVERAFQKVQENYGIPNVSIHLIKNIPLGSGLGGGSSDASFTLKMLNQLFQLNLPEDKLFDMAIELGSDCPFFLNDTPQIASGRGEILEPYQPILNGKWLLLALPDIKLSTEQAFKNLSLPTEHEQFDSLLQLPLQNWRDQIKNDFQEFQYSNIPELPEIHQVIQKEATYTSMSGTGSAIFGIFEKQIRIELPCRKIWLRL